MDYLERVIARAAAARRVRAGSISRSTPACTATGSPRRSGRRRRASRCRPQPAGRSSWSAPGATSPRRATRRTTSRRRVFLAAVQRARDLGAELPRRASHRVGRDLGAARTARHARARRRVLLRDPLRGRSRPARHRAGRGARGDRAADRGRRGRRRHRILRRPALDARRPGRRRNAGGPAGSPLVSTPTPCGWRPGTARPWATRSCCSAAADPAIRSPTTLAEAIGTVGEEILCRLTAHVRREYR